MTGVPVTKRNGSAAGARLALKVSPTTSVLRRAAGGGPTKDLPEPAAHYRHVAAARRAAGLPLNQQIRERPASGRPLRRDGDFAVTWESSLCSGRPPGGRSSGNLFILTNGDPV